MVEFLISRGANKLLKGGSFGTMLGCAVAMGVPELVTYIISEVGIHKTAVDDEGRNAAHIGSSRLNIRDNIGTLRVLPENLLWTKDKHGRLPLHFACGGQRLNILKDLLYWHISEDKINQADDDGWTPLHWACRQWDVSILCFLIERGAKSDSRTLENWTPWDVAVFHDNSDFANTLHRSDPETEANDLVKKEGKQWYAWCNSCMCVIFGTRYTCLRCPDYDLCFKCYPRASLHGPDHSFKERVASDNEEASEPGGMANWVKNLIEKGASESS